MKTNYWYIISVYYKWPYRFAASEAFLVRGSSFETALEEALLRLSDERDMMAENSATILTCVHRLCTEEDTSYLSEGVREYVGYFVDDLVSDSFVYLPREGEHKEFNNNLCSALVEKLSEETEKAFTQALHEGRVYRPIRILSTTLENVDGWVGAVREGGLSGKLSYALYSVPNHIPEGDSVVSSLIIKTSDFSEIEKLCGSEKSNLGFGRMELVVRLNGEDKE